MPARSGFTVAHPSCPFGGAGSLICTRRSGASGPDRRPGAFDPTVRAPRYRGALLKYSSASVVIVAVHPLDSPGPFLACPHIGTEFHYLDMARRTSPGTSRFQTAPA